jgi:hypothetical protein
VLHKRLPGVGTTEVYGQMFRVPSDWATEISDVGWGVTISQPNYGACDSPSVSLVAHANGVQIVILGGQCSWSGTPGSSTPSYQYNNSTQLGAWPNAPRAIPDGDLKPGVWQELVYEINWETNYTGSVKVWYKTLGQSTWTQTLDVENVPTQQYGINETGQCISASGTWCDGSTRYTYDKIGAYASAGSHAITVWQDGYVKGTSVSAVESRMP